MQRSALGINGPALRPGKFILPNGGFGSAVTIQHTQPGKGGAYLQVELRNLETGSKLNERFRASENVEKVRLEQRRHQFLFSSDDRFTFMDSETYDQVELNGALLGEAVSYLQDGMEVRIERYEGKILVVALPDLVTLDVRETEPVGNGQTVAA